MSSDRTLRSLFAQITVFLGVQLIHVRCLCTCGFTIKFSKHWKFAHIQIAL